MRTWGLFSYASHSRQIPLKRVLGWCGDCAGVVAVEVLPTQAEIDHARNIIASMSVVLNEVRSQAPGRWHWVTKLLRLPPEMPEGAFELWLKLKDARHDLKEDVQRLSALRHRRSSARCLECGSQDCRRLPRLSLAAEPTGFVHPGCGGEILSEPSGFRISIRLQHRIYDLEGCLLEAEEA
jgi:hypothetical protein